MNNAVIVALQVLITAQVFLLGLAAASYATDTVGRLREQLDRVNGVVLGASGATFSADAADVLRRATGSVGAELRDFEERLVPMSLLAQLVVSGAVFAAVMVAEVAVARRHGLSLEGDPLVNPIYAGGYGIALAALVGPLSVLLQIIISRQYLLRMRDAVLAGSLEVPEARAIVAVGLAGTQQRDRILELTQDSDVSHRNASTGDPILNAAVCDVIHSAVIRRYGMKSAAYCTSAIVLSSAEAEQGKHRQAFLLAQRAFAVGQDLDSMLRLRAATNLADQTATLGNLQDAKALLECEIARASDSLRPSNPALIEARKAMVALLAEGGEPDLALKLADDLVPQMRKTADRADPGLFRFLLNVAIIKVELGIGSAVSELERLSAAASDDFGSQHLLSLECRLILGNALWTLQANHTGLEIVAAVREEASALFGSDNDVVRQAKTLLRDIEQQEQGGMVTQ